LTGRTSTWQWEANSGWAGGWRFNHGLWHGGVHSAGLGSPALPPTLKLRRDETAGTDACRHKRYVKEHGDTTWGHCTLAGHWVKEKSIYLLRQFSNREMMRDA
jgi:hypothetical protein